MRGACHDPMWRIGTRGSEFCVSQLTRPPAGKNEVKLAIQNLNEVLPWLQVRSIA